MDISGLIYLNTNGGPPPIGSSTVPQLWDFSQPEQPYECVLRTDIIAATNGDNCGSFPAATYAEQDSFSPTNIFGWRYYGFQKPGNTSGRLCYGLDEPTSLASSQAVFSPPVVDIPAYVQLNQTWSNSLSWQTLYFQVLAVSNYLSAVAVVDAYGALILPQIGTVPALRVHEVHSYIISELTTPPTTLSISTNDYYYWLVPGLGVAAQVEVLGNNVLFPITLPCTNTVQRMWSASYFTNNPVGEIISTSPTNLQASLQGDSVVLNWSGMTNCTNFRVDFATSLAPSNWASLGFTTVNSWTDAINFGQGFYRIVGNPQ